MKCDFKNCQKLGGVYRICNLENGREYYGSTYWFKDRYKTHLRHLRNNIHDCKFLQRDWNKIQNEDVFLFEVIEVVPKLEDDNLWALKRIEVEQKYLDVLFNDLNKDKRYNSRKKAGDPRKPKMKEEIIEILRKKSEDYYSKPENRQKVSEKTKEYWKNNPANVTVTNITKKQSYFIDTTLIEFLRKMNIDFHIYSLVNGNRKYLTDNNGDKWILGTELPLYVNRSGECRKPMSSENRLKYSNGAHAGKKILNISTLQIFTVEYSLKEFERETKIPYDSLLELVSGKIKFIKHHGGYVLCEEGKDYTDPKVIEEVKSFVLKKQKKVLQIDIKTGDIIKVWNSAEQIEKDTGIGFRTIFNICTGKTHKSINGFYWCYEDKSLQEKYKRFPQDYKTALQVTKNFKKEESINKEKKKSNNFRVLQIDIETGDIINLWESVYRASEELTNNGSIKYSRNKIYKVCTGVSYKYKNFFWCFENIELQRRYNVFPDNWKHTKYIVPTLD